MRRLLAACAILSALTMGVAAAETEVCYAAKYSKAHLNKYPGQTPTSLSIKLSKQDTNLIFEVSATLRGKKGTWSESGGCFEEDSQLKCSVDCDGGGVELKPFKGGLTVYNSRGFRVTQAGCDGEAESHMVQSKPGNRRFTLEKTNMKACE